ncbi:MAG: inorganic phosphate transporter [Elusimicrobia bacterium GWA2_62_23]|nr:MAG: inorganic phosphate transporter [Elusimicrobia bacterium GWA2_62_23]OGR70506.1 MAG: inorganic phosphate transporter [Elusimicrobia bacterium GWC2_63_65]
MDSTLIAIIFLVALALFFDFLNGFHDAANSIATIVATRVLSPKYAVMWAAFFNFIAFAFFGLHVAGTIGKGIVNIAQVDSYVIFGALVGASAWNLITWYYGIPSSSSHALVGGLIGSALVKAGPGMLVMKGIIKTLVFIVVSPLVGMLLAIVLGLIVYNLVAKQTPSKVDHWFRKGQLVSAALYSLGHGGNDAQKTMGIIAGLLFSAGYLGTEFHVPLWVVLTCHAAIAIGTMSGGWRIVKTMGDKLSKLRPVDGFCAEGAASMVLFGASAMGVPISTTHTITGAIVGVGTLKNIKAVKWGVAGNIVWAWVITIPAAAAISALFYWFAVRVF